MCGHLRDLVCHQEVGDVKTVNTAVCVDNARGRIKMRGEREKNSCGSSGFSEKVSLIPNVNNIVCN